MTKSADYGMFREDAYITPCNTSYRYVKTINGRYIYQYTRNDMGGMRLDHSREYVRKNIKTLSVLDVSLTTKPWQCECEVESFEWPTTVMKIEIPSILINGHKIEGDISTLRRLLGIQ